MDQETTTDRATDSLPALVHPGVGESGPTKMIAAFPIADLKPAPWNPRKHFDPAQLAELAADIAARGVLENLVVRDLGTHHEIVCGERRFLAAQRAGLAAVPVTVRELDDRQALECAISENGQREGLHPLEESDGFLALHTQHGETPEDIAVRFGVSVKLVHQRLSLARLCPEGRAAFLAGKFSWGVAQRIARLSVLDYQREAVKYATETRNSWQGPLTVAEAGRWIEQRYHLTLASAPFDPKDAALVPSVGACVACPKSTDAQVPMFGDEVSPGQCLDPVCFAVKKEKAWEIKAASVANGRPVLTAEQSAAIVSGYGIYAGVGKGYVLPEHVPHEHGGRKSWAQLLGTHLPATVIVRDAAGDPVELISPDDLKAAIKSAGIGVKKVAGSKGPTSIRGREEKSVKDWRAEQELAQKVADAVGEACAEAFDKKVFTDSDRALWQFITMLVMTSADGATADNVIARRNKGKRPIAVKGDHYAEHKEEVAALSASGCRTIIFEVVLEEVRSGATQCTDTWRDALATLLRVDVKAVEKRVRDEAEAKKKPAPPAKPPAKASKKPAGKTATKPAAKPAAKKGGAK